MSGLLSVDRGLLVWWVDRLRLVVDRLGVGWLVRGRVNCTVGLGLWGGLRDYDCLGFCVGCVDNPHSVVLVVVVDVSDQFCSCPPVFAPAVDQDSSNNNQNSPNSTSNGTTWWTTATGGRRRCRWRRASTTSIRVTWSTAVIAIRVWAIYHYLSLW